MAGRNPLLNPFTSTSIWTIPIGTGAVYGLPQPTASQASLFPVTINSMTPDVSPVMMDPSQPIVPFQQNGGFNAANRCTVTGGTFANLPCAPSFVISGTVHHNYSGSAVAADGIKYLQGGAFARCVAGGNATMEASAIFTESIYGDGLIGAKGGSKLSCLGGVLRVGELVPGGVIPHALAINIDMLANGYSTGSLPNGFVWPATKSDGYVYSGDNGQGPNHNNPKLATGSLLAIPPSVFSGLSFNTGAGLILATCLMNYGAYLSNDTKQSVRAICTEVSAVGDVAGTINSPGEFRTAWGFAFNPGGVGNTPWAVDCDTIFAALHVVTNVTAANYANGTWTAAGGGTPLVPLAPALGGSALAPVWTSQSTASEHFVPNASSQIVAWNPSLLFAGISSEVFNVTPVYPITIGPTVSCGTASLPATTLMGGN